MAASTEPKLNSPEAQALLRSAHAAGKGRDSTAQMLRDQLGIVVNARSVGVALAALGPKPVRTPASKKVSTSLDEVKVLERRAKALQQVVANAQTPRDIVALNKELRDTFASIRVARASVRLAQESTDHEIAEVLEKLTRFALDNPAPDQPATNAVPEEQDPAVSVRSAEAV